MRVYYHGYCNSHDRRGRKGTIFCSTLPLPPAHEHWDIYLQLCIWDGYHIFLIALLLFTIASHCYSMRFTNLLNYHLTDWWCDNNFCLFTWWFDSRFLLQHLTQESAGFELASTITLVLQANRLSVLVTPKKWANENWTTKKAYIKELLQSPW